MDSGRTLLLGMLVVVILIATITPVAAESGGLTPAQQTIDADTVSLRADLHEDGTAAWQVTYRVELESQNETDAFERLENDISEDSAPYVDRFTTRMRRAMWTAENATGRDMSLRNVSVSGQSQSLPQGNYGVVIYRLEWINFSRVDNDVLHAGDAIDEFFLDEQTSLTVAWPEAFHLVSHQPDGTAVDNGSVTWQGRQDFGAGEPRLIVAPGAPGGEAVGAGGPPLLPLGVLIVILFAITGWLYYRQDGRASAPNRDRTPSTAIERDPSNGSAEEGPPPDLLSNEERVLRVLRQHGGRMKQQQVTEELEWTDAKTSQVVSELREAGELESFRLGRENVLTLPDVSIEPGHDEKSNKEDEQ